MFKKKSEEGNIFFVLEEGLNSTKSYFIFLTRGMPGLYSKKIRSLTNNWRKI